MHELLDSQLYRTSRDCGRITERMCREFGLSRRRWRILATVVVTEGSSLSDLASMVELDLAQTSRAVGVLARAGLLRRLSCAKNGRKARIELTAGGRRLQAAVFARYREINNSLLLGLSSKRVRDFESTLRHLRERALVVSADSVAARR